MDQGLRKKIKSFTDLYAWQEAHKLVLIIYRMTEQFPSKELFGLSNQMRRCAVSVSSNIAEGFSRQSVREKLHFNAMALGSLTELQNQLLIAKDIEYIAESTFDVTASQTVVVSKLINGMLKRYRLLIHNP